MIISNINWMSKSAKEAEILVSDGAHEIILFCYPCYYSENQNIEEYIHPLDVENFQKTIDNQVSIFKLANSYYGYKVVGIVESFDNSIIAVGELKFELSTPIPSWVAEGDLIEFESMRFDLW